MNAQQLISAKQPQLKNATPFDQIVSNLKNVFESMGNHLRNDRNREINDSTLTFGRIFSTTPDRLATHDMALQAIKEKNVKIVPELGITC